MTQNPVALTPEHPFIGVVMREVRRAYGTDLVSVALFGSVARRTARPDSDLDLFVVVEGLPRGHRAARDLRSGGTRPGGGARRAGPSGRLRRAVASLAHARRSQDCEPAPAGPYRGCGHPGGPRGGSRPGPRRPPPTAP